ncbi:MAG: hypothetical protein KUG82_10845 [Pseudomonadales bacterium]|nr:hypothetical protein [Pseudomonadales bacterium]
MSRAHSKGVSTGPSSPSGPYDAALKAIRKGYQAFNAAESIPPSGIQTLSCTAKLYYTNNNITSTVAGVSNNGVHAEMDALKQFYVGTCHYNDHAFSSVTLQMESGPLPCCIRCAAVCGLLGVFAMPNTHKTPTSMGTAQWQLPDDLAQLLAIKTGENKFLYQQFGSVII